MELRDSVDILRRQKWLILQVGLLLAVAVGVVSGLRTPLYRATAVVLLRPNDPNEQLNPSQNARPVSIDPNRYAVAQQGIIASEAVASEAVKFLPGASVEEIEAAVSVRQAGQSDILRISATGPDPDRARDIANAVAQGYLENRRQSAVAGLRKAADDIEAKLAPLQERIVQLDSQLAGANAPPAVTSVPAGPAAPATPAPEPPAPAAGPAPEPPRSVEALKAARYAADVQYTTLYQRQQELLVDISLKRGEAELVSQAKTPEAPFFPRPLRDAALGAMLGLVLGAAIAFVKEHLDDRLRSVADVERATELPILALLPYEEESNGSADVAAITRPLGPLAEAVRSLRTSIQFLGLDPAIRVIVVTSAEPGEGKSLVAANLAAVYAQAGYTTYLVSGDLRRPQMVERFGIAPTAPGLSDIIANNRLPQATSASVNGMDGSTGAHATNGTAPNGVGTGAGVTGVLAAPGAAARSGQWLGARPLDLLVPTSIPNLFVLPSGPAPANPAELIGSRRMSDLLGELSQAADVIVIDTPPLLPVTDGAVLGVKADGVLLVTALDQTSGDSVRRARRVLAATGARLLGTVVNKAHLSKRGGYGAYYGYYAEPPERRRFWQRAKPIEPVAAGALSPVSLEPDTGGDGGTGRFAEDQL